ncbi:MAG: hypothetical protein Q7J48_20565 [Nocardioides sp.]|nr:hypothetical protein [Nocardioides sp.]
MTTTAPPPSLSLDDAHELAGDLLRQLAEHIGDESSLDAVLLRWLDVLNEERLYQVCTVALRTTFVDCLSITHPNDPTTKETP